MMLQALQARLETPFPQAERPTIYFIGVSTGRSSIMGVFPRWAEYLGLGEVVIRGVDCRLHDDPASYRRVVEHIKADPLSLGALVTTHKIDLLQACRDLFDGLDRYANLLGEVSSISKVRGQLIGHAKDTMTSGLALRSFLPPDHWRRTKAEVLVLGAGGPSTAFTCHIMEEYDDASQPEKVIVTDRSQRRLDEIRHVHQKLGGSLSVEYHHTLRPQDNDVRISALRAGSLVVNATGLGKDAPGSPITDAALFPEGSYAWDFNYRGQLEFLRQARARAGERHLHVEDGWIYFIHGWTRVIAEVFGVEIPTSGPRFEEMSRIAAANR